MAKKEKKEKKVEETSETPEEPKVNLASLIKSAKTVIPDNYCVRTLDGDVIGRGFKNRQQAKVFRDAQPKAKSGSLQVFVSRDVAHPHGPALTLPCPPDSAKSYSKKTLSAEEVVQSA
jgi:hypothetical protein